MANGELSRGVGRRPGAPDTRGEILAAARREFSAAGFDRTSLRGVARSAGVDPALVHHYFASKQDLFLAAMELPFDPRLVLRAALSGPPESVGERLVRAVLGVWEEPATRPALLSVFRSAMANEQGSALLKDGLLTMIVEQLASLPGLVDGQRRAGLAASQIVGLLATRYALRLSPVSEMRVEELAETVGPTITRYLFDPLEE